MIEPMNSEIDLIYSQIKDWIDQNDVPNSSNIIILVALLIRCTEKSFKDKTGEYKKQIVLKVIYKVIANSNLTPDAKLALIMTIDTTMSAVIDTMIGVANQKIDLGKMKKSMYNCFSCV